MGYGWRAKNIGTIDIIETLVGPKRIDIVTEDWIIKYLLG
jgi:hypothetical protein